MKLFLGIENNYDNFWYVEIFLRAMPQNIRNEIKVFASNGGRFPHSSCVRMQDATWTVHELFKLSIKLLPLQLNILLHALNLDHHARRTV